MDVFISNILKGFTNFLQTAANEIVSALLQAIIDLLCPLLVSFLAIMTKTVEGTLKMSTSQFLSTFPAAPQIKNYLITLGVAFAVGLFLLGLFRNLFSGLGFQAQSPFQMSIRFLMAVFMCLASSSIFEFIFTGLFNKPYDSLMKFTTDTIDWQELAPDNIINLFINIGKDFNPFASSDKGQARLLASILVLALMLMIVYNFFILVVEMFERYLMVNILVMSAPLASSSLVLDSTSNIFKAYCRMFFGQNLLLLCNAITLCMVNSSVGMFANAVAKTQNAKAVIISALLIVAFLKIAQHLDNYLRDLGLTVGINGGNMLAEIMVSAKTLHNAYTQVKNLGKEVMKAGTKTTGTSGGSPGILGGTGGFHFTPPIFGSAARGPKPKGPSGFGGGGAFANGFNHTAASSPIHAASGSSNTAGAASFMTGRTSAADTVKGIKDVGQAANAVNNVNQKASGTVSNMNPANNPNVINGIPFDQKAAVGAFNQMPNKQRFNTGNTAKMQALSTIGAPALGNKFAPSGMNLSSIKSTGNGALIKDNEGNLHMFSQTNPLSMPSFQNMHAETFAGSDGNTYYHENVNEMGEPMQAYMNASYEAGKGSLDAGEIQQSIDSYQALNSPAESVEMPSAGYQDTQLGNTGNNESIASGAYQNLSEGPSGYQGVQTPSNPQTLPEENVSPSVQSGSSLPSMPAPHEGENTIPSETSSASPQKK